MTLLNAQPLSFTLTDIEALACKILEQSPDPAPRFLILRDVLHRPPSNPALRQAEDDLHRSRWVVLLAESQFPDGSWGRFHSQDTQVKSVFPTSEFAIRRALALGLDCRHPVLQKASGYIQAHLRGEVTWSDRIEKQDHPGVWAANTRTISAAMLALIEGEHPLIHSQQEYWADVVAAAFSSGSYDREAEIVREQALTGIPSRRLYPFHPYYPLIVLSSPGNLLDAELEQRGIAHMLQRPDGMYYVYPKRLDAYPRSDEKGFEGWLYAQEILSRFQGWKAFAPDFLNGLWSQRNIEGLWDLGKESYRSFLFPLSESWKRPGARMVDCSVRILSLMRRYFDL